MEDMYMIADGAVLGGTFINYGGHNIWEAVQFSIPVFFGQHYHTQLQSYERVLDAGVGFCVRNARELANGLVRALKDNPKGLSSKMSVFREKVKKDATPLESYLP